MPLVLWAMMSEKGKDTWRSVFRTAFISDNNYHQNSSKNDKLIEAREIIIV